MIENDGKLSKFQKHTLETTNNLPLWRIALQMDKAATIYVSLASAVSEKYNSITTQDGIRIKKKKKTKELQFVRKIMGIKEGETNNNSIQNLDKHPIVKMELMMIKLIYRYRKCFTENIVMYTHIQKRHYSY